MGERIRNRVAGQSVEVNGISVTIRTTLGVAPLSHDMETIDELIDTADKVLLAAKNDGRDRTMSLCRLCHRHSDVESRIGTSFSSVLRSLPAKAIMINVQTLLHQDQPIRIARRTFLESGIDCACVVNQRSELVGLVTERDFLNAMTSGSPADAKLQTVMSRSISQFQADTPVFQIWQCLQRTPMLRVVVVDNCNMPIGFVRRRALLQLLHDSEEPKG